MGTVIRRLAITLVALTALVALALVLLVLLIDLNRFKPAIERAVEAKTGREFTIAGPIGWSLFPTLGADLRDVSLGNSPNFDQPMAQIDRATLGVALLPLFSGELQVSEVVLEHPRLLLGIDADGRGNWEDILDAMASDEAPAAPESGEVEEQPVSVAIDGVRIVDGELTWIDVGADQQFVIAPFNLRTGPVRIGEPVQLDLKLIGRSEAPALEVHVELSSAVTIDEQISLISWHDFSTSVEASGPDIPNERLQLTLRGDGTLDLDRQTVAVPAFVMEMGNVVLAGSIEGREVVDAPAFSGQIEAAPFSLRELLERLDIDAPLTADPNVLSHAAMTTRFTATPEQVSLSALRTQLDDTTFNGTIEARLGDITAVDFQLTLDAINLDRYLPPEEEDDAATPPAPGQSNPAEPLPGMEDPFAWMDGLALTGKLAAGQVTVTGIEAKEIAATVRLAERVLTLDPILARLYGGMQQLSVRIDARQAEPVIRIQMALENVALGVLLGDLVEQAPLRGTGALTADLQMQGLDADRIKETLDGSGKLSIRNGAVQGVNIAQELRNAVALLRNQPRSQAAPETDFTEMTLEFAANQGVISWPSLAAQSPLLRLGSQGSLNLVNEKLDIRLDAAVVKSLKGQGGEPLSELAGFNIPVELEGSFADPKVRVDLKGILKQTVLGEKQEELENKIDERKEELREKARKELQRGLDKLFR